MASTLDNYYHVDSGVDRPDDFASLDGGTALNPTMSVVFRNTLVPENTGAYAASFVRATAATYTDSSDVIQTVTSGNPRYEDSAVLLENNKTNIILKSEDFSNNVLYWDWTQGGTYTVTANSTVAPDGATTADTIADTDVTATSFGQQQTTTAAANTKYCYSLFVKKTSSPSSYPVLQMINSGGVAQYANVFLGTEDGTTWNGTGTGSTADASGAIDYGTYYRFWATYTSHAACDAITIRVLPALTTTYGDPVGSVTTTGSIIAWGMQIEAGAYPSSYIATNTSAVPRNDDATTYTPSPATGEVSIFMELEPLVNFDDLDVNEVRLFGSTDAGTDAIRTLGGGGWSMVASGAGFYVVLNSADFNKGQIHKLALSVAQNGSSIVTNAWLDGVAKITNEVDTCTLDHSSTNIELGHYTANGTTDMKVYKFRVWNYALPSTALQALTN